MNKESKSDKNEILYITHSPSFSGAIHFFNPRYLRKADIVSFPLSMSCYGVPTSLEPEEIERCIGLETTTLFQNTIRQFVQVPFSKYKKIVIWHMKDNSSLMLLYFICYLFPHSDLYHAQIACYDLRAFKEAFNNIKRITPFQQSKFANIYRGLIGSDCIPKISKGWQIKLSSREKWKRVICRNVLYKEPRILNRVIVETIGKQPLNCTFPDYFFMDLLFELISENKLIPVEIKKTKDEMNEDVMKTESFKPHFKSLKEYRKLNPLIKVGEFSRFSCNTVYDGVDLLKSYQFKLLRVRRNRK